MKYVLSARADSDLEEIFDFSLHRWGEAQARRYAERIDEQLTRLARTPGIGRARPELGGEIRSFGVGAHVIFYRPMSGGVLILTIRHSKRRPIELGDLGDE